MQSEKSNWQVAEVQVSYQPGPFKNVKIGNPEDAHKVLRKMWDPELLNLQEQFCVLFLNAEGKTLGFRCLSTGSLTATTVEIRLLFSICCNLMATAIIIAHNHPSGSKTISDADIELTQKIKKAADIFNVKLRDHIILTPKSYVSMSSKHML